MRDFPVLELHYYDARKFHSPPGRRNSRQQVVPRRVMSEAQYQFDNDLVAPNGSGDGRDLHLFGDLVDEVLAVKASDLPAANSASHDRNAVHIRLWNHSLHGGVNVLIGKLSLYVPVEECHQIE